MHRIDSVVKYIKGKVKTQDRTVGIVLGNGFSDFLSKIEWKEEIPFSTIPNLNSIGKDKENNKFVFGKIGGRSVVVVLGRLHYNLGYNISDISDVIFILKELGCEKLILTASMGSINPKIHVGDIATVVDHINLTGRNPLYKCDYNKYGNVFADMLSPYDEQSINSLLITAKKEMNINVKTGIFVEFPGPSSETYSEALMAKKMGADFTGFNVCNEVIAAKYCDLPVVVFGLITNYGACLTANKIRHEDIVYNRGVSSGYYLDLLSRFVIKL